MQRKKSKLTRYFSKFKSIEILVRWVLFLCLSATVIIIYNFHSSSDSKDWSTSQYDRNEEDTFSITNEKNFSLNAELSLKSKNVIKDKDEFNSNEVINSVKLMEDANPDGYDTGKTSQADFILHAEHNLDKNIKTQGKTSIIGYSKPIDLEKYNQPTLEEVQGLYGDKVVIHGLDQCNAYRDNVSGRSRYIVPSGLQNTGTNLLYKLLQRNCYIPERWAESPSSKNSQTPFTSEMEEVYDCFTQSCKKILDTFDLDTGMRKNAPWWKHAPPSWRDNPPYSIARISNSNAGEQYDRMNALPIVIIKDPVNWMSSMCRNQYEVRFYRPMGRCPKLAPLNKPLPKLNKSRHAGRTPKQRPVIITPPKGLVNKFFIKYDSLADMWVDYYNEWTNNALFPNLIVRYEDLLFHPKEVINQVCTCAGGKMRDDFRLMEKSSKAHGNGILGPNTSRTGLSAAIIMYGTKEIRDSVLDQADKKFAGEKLNSNVMDTFHYQPP